eukprot:CAMPEP_0174272964 /NCGR_PEP_ID=MMETSP0439-20130205/52888_1 /TAXON_ID=0 /ORGANISM="Stereomyxa ramosa, Strain Chinc5" /LENGTH=373 /DNA_ID=CAMNT_0015363807 /DNA_START=118 /DNA_END=1236 /DNA_ORIENTATION=-
MVVTWASPRDNNTTSPPKFLSQKNNENSALFGSEVKKTAATRAKVRYKLREETGGRYEEREGGTREYRVGPYDSPHINSAVLTNLLPDRLYLYLLCPDPLPSLVAPRDPLHPDCSPPYSFVSPPTPGQQGITVGVVGDMGTRHGVEKVWERLIEVRTNNFLDLVLHAGDLSYANFIPHRWDTYGAQLTPLIAFTPYIPTVGNHDSINDFLEITERFRLDEISRMAGGGQFYWSVNYGNIHLIVLSTETGLSTKESTQYFWLQQDLINIQRHETPWVIVLLHRPWYTSNLRYVRFMNADDMRDLMEPLFAQHHVDVVIGGHVHAYERTYKMFKGKRNNKGTVYLTVGNSNPQKQRDSNWANPPPSWSAKRTNQW